MSGLSIGRVRASALHSAMQSLKNKGLRNELRSPSSWGAQPFEVCEKAAYLSTACLNPWPAAKAGTVLAVIFISLPVAGLRPARALRLRGRKVPNPTTVTRFPFATLWTIAWNTALTASPAAALLTLPAFAAASTRSDFVTTCGMRSLSPVENHRIEIENETQRGRRRAP